MPELPEVETVRRDLQRFLPGKRIRRVRVTRPKLVEVSLGRQTRGVASFSRRLVGRTIRRVRRRGKLLIIDFSNADFFLLVHLKMTGQLIYRDSRHTAAGGHGWPLVEDLPNTYTHIQLELSGKATLFFNDVRQFGYMRIVDAAELERVLATFGPEPLVKSFTPVSVEEALHRRKTALKNVLLNQTLVAGLGNIYVDEACFAAGVRPTRQAQRVTTAEARRLHRAIQRVLRQAITARGTTFGSFRDGLGGEGDFVRRLKVYGRAGEPCRRCTASLKRVIVGGRGTVYCPHCQR